MKCPHCDYEYRWDSKSESYIGSEGEFYHLAIEMKRTIHHGFSDTSDMYGCPSCRKVFIGYP